MLTALIALPASAQTIIGLATTEDFDAIGLISAKEEFPGGTKILENEAASFSLAYDDSWGRNISYSKYGKVYVGSSSEIELGQGAVGNTNPTFVSYQSGVMSAGAVFEINAKMDGWITVFTKLNPNKQYVVFEGKDNPLAYTLGVAGPDYSINYTLPSDKDGYIDFTSPYASRYFIPATKQSTNESGILLWDVNGEVIASTTKPSDGTAIMEDIPGETKPQFPWMVAGLEVAPAESTGFLTFKVKAGKTYYFSALGSKMVCGGFVFTGSAEEPAVTFAATEELPEVGFKASLPAPEGTSPGTTPVDPFDPSFESGNSTIVLANSEILGDLGLTSAKYEMPGGLMILNSEVGSFGLAYDDEWGTSLDYRTYRDIRVGNSDEFQLDWGVVGNTNPTFVSYQSGVMSAGAVFEIKAKKNGWMTVFTRLSPNKQYVVFEGETDPCAYTLGVAGSDYTINYSLPSDDNGFINFASPDASRYFITSTLTEVDGNGVASYYKPQAPWDVAGFDQNPEAEIGTGFLTFKVKAGKTYYFSALGSKMVCGGFVFTDTAEEPAVTFCATEELPEVTFETGLVASPGLAAGESFKYEGLWYTVLDPYAKTCKTRDGKEENEIISSGNTFDGNLVIPETVSDGENLYTVTEIGQLGFNRCDNILSVEFPSTLKYIGDHAFRECAGITSIVLPESLDGMGISVFKECPNLKSAYIPNSIKEIKDWTFSMCGSLESVRLPESLEIIRNFAFEFCPITSLNFYASLKEITEYAFMGSEKISSVVYDASMPIQTEDIFTNRVYTNALLTMKNATLADIRATEKWNRFRRVVASDGTEDPGIILLPGDDFEYEGLWYTVLDAEAKTCKTKDGTVDREPGNTVVGDLVIPSSVSDGTTNYKVVEIGF